MHAYVCVCACLCMPRRKLLSVYTSGAIRICLCLCVCLRGGVCVCDIYTPYCPISSALSTHHNCQYPVRYEAEKEKEGRRRALKMDIIAVYLWSMKRWI